MLKKGDLLFAAAGTIGKSYLHLSDEEESCYAGYLVRFRPTDELLGRYISYWSQSIHFWDQVNAGAVVSTIANFSAGRYRNLEVPLPDPASIEVVVRYLDNAEMRIARAIQAKQRVAELLREREQQDLIAAVIGSANSLAFDGRVDWLPGIPPHWEVKRLGSLLCERGEWNSTIRVHQVLSLLRKRGVVPYEEKGNIGNKKSDDISRYKVVLPGDIVVNCMNVIIGSVGISRYEGCLSPVYYVLRTRRDDYVSEYFASLFELERFHKSLIRFGKGILAHRMRISMLDLKTVLLPVPPPSEQMSIVERVRRSKANSDAAISAIEREVVLLEEYRMRLISDVVTGKKDVRRVASGMKDVDPEELAAVLAGVAGEANEHGEEGGFGVD